MELDGFIRAAADYVKGSRVLVEAMHAMVDTLSACSDERSETEADLLLLLMIANPHS